MGMFDYVENSDNFKCPICGAALTELQTKDFNCLMETIPVSDIYKMSTMITVFMHGPCTCSKFVDVQVDNGTATYRIR